MATERLIEELLTFSRLLRPGRRAEMTPEQYWLMRHLRREGPQRISDLANALGITNGSATVACQRLEKAGLLTRKRQLADERIVQIALTDQGQALIDSWRRSKREAVNQLLSVLDEPEQQELHRLIERLLSEAEEHGFGEERKNDSNH